jgi:hypothetical protein
MWKQLSRGIAKTFSPAWALGGAVGGILVDVVVEAVPVAVAGAAAGVAHGVSQGQVFTLDGLAAAAGKGAATALAGRYLVYQARKVRSGGEGHEDTAAR